VSQQDSACSEISSNLTNVATSTGSIAKDIAGMRDTSDGTSKNAHEARSAATELANVATQLNSLVGRFKVS